MQEIPNPFRGQYEDLLLPLFPQRNSADKQYPAWPGSYDASMRVSWRQLQPADPKTFPPGTPDDQKYDFSVIDDALTKLSARNMRMTLRVAAYNSCCDAEYPNNTNIKIPDWLRDIPGTSTSYPPTATSDPPAVTQVIPNWNNPAYLDAFAQLLTALGRRYDGDERLSVFQFSGYGDFGENHNAYQRDVLNDPGPAFTESRAALGYYSQFRDQTITKLSIERLVAAHVNAFPRTQLVTTPQNPEIVRQLLGADVTKLAAPVGFAADCLGAISPVQAWASDIKSYYVLTKDPLVKEFRQRLASVPMTTEWCDFRGSNDAKGYYEKALRDIVTYHVSMTSSINFPEAESRTAMDPALYSLWARANVFAGYRYSVEGSGTPSLHDGMASIPVTWTNFGAAAATEKWVPGYRLVDFSGAMMRELPATVSLKTLVTAEPPAGADEPVPASTTESVQVPLVGLRPGHYTLQASVTWQHHKPRASRVVNYPPMQLARDGRDATGWYPVATLDIPFDDILASMPR